MRDALRRLLQWQGQTDPDVAQLQAAIANLAHREEAAPAMLEAEEVVVGDLPGQPSSTLQPQPGTAAWAPPGGRLADAGNLAEPRKQDSEGATAVTYRAPAAAPAALTTASSSTAVSTAVEINARQPVTARKVGPGAAGKRRRTRLPIRSCNGFFWPATPNAAPR